MAAGCGGPRAEAARISPISASPDRQPGDAEADAAAAALSEIDGYAIGDYVYFTDPDRGFDALTLARVVNVLPGRQLVVEAVVVPMGFVIEPRHVRARGRADE